MKAFLFFHLIFLGLSLSAWSQPYGGTIFVDPDIIVPTDSSAFLQTTYAGRGERTVFDRRIDNWTTINAFLFNVVWNDGLSSVAVVNPEFQTVEAAQLEADKYGRAIGQLPTCLRTDVDEIWIHKGVNLFGGGNRSILIHTGQSRLYENDGILEETLVHEASHTSLDATHALAAGWTHAQQQDPNFISTYARDFPQREDIAESFLLWIAVRFRKDRISKDDFNKITTAIPNRLSYFDEMECDMFPIKIQDITSLKDLAGKEQSAIFYPNPTSDMVYLMQNIQKNTVVNIYNSLGVLVAIQPLNNKTQGINLSNLPDGLYVLALLSNGKILSQKIIKK